MLDSFQNWPLVDTQLDSVILSISQAFWAYLRRKSSSLCGEQSSIDPSFHQSYNFELQNENGVRNIRTLLVTPGQLNTEMFAGFKPPRQFFAPVIDIIGSSCQASAVIVPGTEATTRN
nr:CBM_HP1_G0009530.mRNA.1.CDS.1 [Saccharomyces cerevisiae]